MEESHLWMAECEHARGKEERQVECGLQRRELHETGALGSDTGKKLFKILDRQFCCQFKAITVSFGKDSEEKLSDLRTTVLEEVQEGLLVRCALGLPLEGVSVTGGEICFE